MTKIKPIILGCAGKVLTQEEKHFFEEVNPFGFILFQRNCCEPAQIRQLTADLRASVGRDDLPVFIDQEGGRVARLAPPHWPAYSNARQLGLLYEMDPALGRMAVHLHSLLIARMLRDVGINGNCAPVLDLWIDGASSAIGDRVFSADPAVVEACARVAVDTYLSNGVFPVIKHIPGHGRVLVDPHVELPFVDASLDVLCEHDFKTFEALNKAPIAMNCHVVFRSLDPVLPASLSAVVHQEIIRKRIGFEGLLFSDDLAMGALNIPLEQRAVQALGAGADIALYCTGELEKSRNVCSNLPYLSDKALARWEKAKVQCNQTLGHVNVQTMQARLDQLMEIVIKWAA